MTRPLSPIERMIDKATGFKPGKPVPMVTMECPHCGRTKQARRDKSDPHGTAKVVATCDKCPQENGVVDYFNAAGQQIDLEGRPM